jgi:hypothetical protein
LMAKYLTYIFFIAKWILDLLVVSKSINFIFSYAVARKFKKFCALGLKLSNGTLFVK